jgi:branched-chain amino acid transport system permease protein
MRATADGHYIAQSVGIRVSTVFSVTWGIAGVICAIAGLALMDRIGFSIVQTPSVVIFCFAAVLMGGLDSVPGAILGGIIVGLVSSLASGLISSQVGMLMPYIVLMVVILVRPEGIWGLKRIERI